MDAESTPTNVVQAADNLPDPFHVGKVLDGKYEVIALLGKGGMGAVYQVRHILLNVDMALKTLDSQRLGDANSARRFQTEAQAAFSLKHPNLVKVHDFGVLDDGHPFLVMDLVKGKTLQTLIKERGQLSFSEIEPIFVQLCFGLAHAHQQQVVHRDIKPANIMIVDGVPLKDEGSIKILDFGIAKIVNSDRGEMDALTQTGEIFGSPYYMSPEQCSGVSIDQRSDIYSLGCVLFEAITGTPPLVGSNALRTMMLHVNDAAPSLKEATLGSQFSPEIEHIVAKMLAKSPADRYADLGAVAHEIHRVCTSIGGGARVSNDGTQQHASLEPIQKNTLTFTPLSLAGLISGVCIVSSVVTIFVSHYQRNYANTQSEPAIDKVEPSVLSLAPVPDGVESAPVLNTFVDVDGIKQSFKDCPKISATDISVQGMKKRKLTFPGHTIGVVKYYGIGEGTQKMIKKLAVREIIVPADTALNFWVQEISNREAFAFPFIFDKIEPDIFNGLYFEGELGDLRTSPEADLQKKEQSAGVIQLFKAASKWKKLTCLNLRKVAVTKDLWNAVNDLPHIEYLALQEDKYHPLELAQQPFLRRLKRIDLLSGDIAEPLKSLSKSRNLELISIGPEAILTSETPQALKSLKGAPRLRTLMITRKEIDDGIVTAISQLPQVVRLDIKRGILSESQKKLLNRNWKLSAASEHEFSSVVDFYKRRN